MSNRFYSLIVIIIISISMLAGCGEPRYEIEVLGATTTPVLVPTAVPCQMQIYNDLAKGQGKTCAQNSFSMTLWLKANTYGLLLEVTANSDEALTAALAKIQAACGIEVPRTYFQKNATGMFTGQVGWEQPGCFESFQ